MGSLVWTGNYSEPFDFKVQTYKGNPVLTFWSGTLLDGYGRGSYYILNQSYDEIAHFQVSKYGENMGDIHEFAITNDDTALVPIYHPITWDLTSVGGSENGWIFENTIQEINIETGELVFEWNASTHVGVNESYNTLPSDGASAEADPWDYFHINSIEKDRNGDYLISARVMDCLYKISGEDGSVIWRLHGKQSDFEIPDEVNFAFQHDARWLNDDLTRLSIFDNGPTATVSYSRGLLMNVNYDNMTVTLIQEFTNQAKTFAQFEGSLQAIDPSNETTNYFLGFGNQPFFTELDHQGNILLDVQFGKTNAVNNYRTYRQQWEGKPSAKPDMHWYQDANSTYFSWNGATEVESWVVLTANASDSATWTNVTVARRTGFETTVNLSDVQNLENFVRGKAVNINGTTLGWTKASDGKQLYDAPEDVQERGNATPTPTPTSTTSTTSSMPSATSAAPSISSSAAATRATHGVMEQVYVAAAAVVVGGLALT